VMSRGGEIYVLDMGKPISILELAKNMIKLYGLEPEKDIKITYSGVRQGEKFAEELINSDEKLIPTDFPSIFVTRNKSKENREEIQNLL
ncbi:unnamed protein product, partial [marine sediment metagenome]